MEELSRPFCWLPQRHVLLNNSSILGHGHIYANAAIVLFSSHTKALDTVQMMQQQQQQPITAMSTMALTELVIM